MLRKTATLAVLDAWQVPQGAVGLQKFAHRVDFEYTPRPGFLYVRSRAISSRANDNHDEFPAEEIEKSYRSFLGKPVFVNHHNANHRRARGVIVAVALHRDHTHEGRPDTWAEVLMEVDAVKFPKLAKAILAGRVNRTSMGVDVEESQCTACLNKATDPAQYCKHLPAMKGRKIRHRDQVTGKLKEEIIREVCRGLSFFENSLLVEEPADPTAYVLGQPDARGLKMTAHRDHWGTMTPEAILPHLQNKHGFTDRSILNAADLPSGLGGLHDRDHHGEVTWDRMRHSPMQPHEHQNTKTAEISDDEIREGLNMPSVEKGRADELKNKFDKLFLGDDADWEDYRLNKGNEAMTDLHRRYEGHPGTFGFSHNEDDEPGSPTGSPYYEIKHHGYHNRDTGWRIRHYNDGPIAEIEHAGEPGESQETIDLPRPSYGSNSPHDNFGHEHLHKILHDWYHGVLTPDEPDENRKYLERNRPRIQRWQRNHGIRPEAMRRQAITGESAEPGPEIFAKPTGTSPVAGHFDDVVDERVAEGTHRQRGEHPHVSAPDHGPYYVTRDPDDPDVREGTYHLLDRHGRQTHPIGGYKGGMFPGFSSAYTDWHRLTHHEDPGPHPDLQAIMKEHNEQVQRQPPQFPHSMIDPEDEEIAKRPDARVFKPEGHSEPDEYHGSYEVVKHPETGRFHVVDNSGRHSGGPYNGFQYQMQAERSRDYIEKRQQGKERAKHLFHQLTDDLDEIFDPGGTAESRESEKNLARGTDLMNRYAGGRGKIKFDSDEDGGQPYYERHHYLPNGNESGWYAKHYGGATKTEMYHQATGDHAHDLVRFSEHEHFEKGSNIPRLHPDFDDINLASRLKDWHDDSETGARRHLEGPDGDPQVRRWKRMHPNGKTPGGFNPTASLAAEAVQYARPEDHPFFQQNPVSHEHIIRTFHEANDDEKAQGMRWYKDAQHVARMLGHGTGHSVATAAGVLSAYSPRSLWPVNLFNASRAMMEPHNPPGPGSGAMGMHQTPARRILAGEHHSEVFDPETAMKTRSFAHLIEHGGDSPEDEREGNHHVVVDRHALSVAVGHRLTKADGDAPIDKQRFYNHVAEKYRHAAKDLSEALGTEIKPHQLQAITWLVQQRKNNAEDEASASAAAKGRRKMDQNSQARWREHHQQHHPFMTGPEAEPNMHLSARQRLAYGETKVPEHVNTLRQEECPVCGESQVWTGQRCPVCGYVAPPDLFRDPDTSKAADVREELDAQSDAEAAQQGLDVPPAGQGSWPAADDQLYHPDQLAPNGVPGVAPTQPDGETQLEGEDPEAPVLVCNVSGTEFPPEEGLAEGDPCPEGDGGVLELSEPEPEDAEELADPESLGVEGEDGEPPLGNDAGGPDVPEEAEAAEEAELEEDEAQDEADEEEEEAENGPDKRPRRS